MSTGSLPPASHRDPGSSASRRILRLLALGLAVALVGAVGVMRARIFDDNLHEVIPGRAYRSGQLGPDRLVGLIEQLGLRSVVNLRGTKPHETWYVDEQRVLAASGVTLHSLRMAANRLPSRQTVRQLVDILDAVEEPFLIHCGAGTDRSGIASALLLLLEGGSLEDARRQFGLRHGYLSALSPSDLQDWLSLYEGWLAQRGASSTPQHLREFAREGYTPYFYDARIEPLRVPQRVEVRRAEPLAFQVTNISPQPWRFQATDPTGVRLDVHIRSLEAAAPFETAVSGPNPAGRIFGPGESIVLEAELPPLPQPGRYRLTVDLVDEFVTYFEDMGSRPLVLELEAFAPPLKARGAPPAVERKGPAGSGSATSP